MASHYLQKYPCPQSFKTVLKKFTREVLRDQPKDLLVYARDYFASQRDGTQWKFESLYNVRRSEEQKFPDPSTIKYPTGYVPPKPKQPRYAQSTDPNGGRRSNFSRKCLISRWSWWEQPIHGWDL